MAKKAHTKTIIDAKNMFFFIFPSHIYMYTPSERADSPPYALLYSDKRFLSSAFCKKIKKFLFLSASAFLIEIKMLKKFYSKQSVHLSVRLKIS